MGRFGPSALVVDSGPGVDPTLQDRMFEPFVREDLGGNSGQGLGLATVKRLVRLR